MAPPKVQNLPPGVIAKAVGAGVLAIAASMSAGYEGFVMKPYRDVVGVLTVCAGHTGKDIEDRDYQPEECLFILKKDMGTALAAVDKCHPGMPDPVRVAMADLVFNAGPAGVCDTKTYTVAKLLQAKQYRRACERIVDWNKAKVAGRLVELRGLTLRRTHFRDYCLANLKPA